MGHTGIVQPTTSKIYSADEARNIARLEKRSSTTTWVPFKALPTGPTSHLEAFNVIHRGKPDGVRSSIGTGPSTVPREIVRIAGDVTYVCAAVILLVDDDASVKKSLHRLLGAHGYEVHGASDQSAVLEAARAHRPDIIILDLHMPWPNGLEIARVLKADPSLNAIRLIAFSASVPDWDENMGLFDQVIEKPASAQVLLDAIAACVQRQR